MRTRMNGITVLRLGLGALISALVSWGLYKLSPLIASAVLFLFLTFVFAAMLHVILKQIWPSYARNQPPLYRNRPPQPFSGTDDGGGDGGAGVREPRRPRPPHMPGRTVALPLDDLS